jgi:hypothetical protein
MKEVQVVAPEWVYSVWPKVVDFVEASLDEGTGEFSAEHLKGWLVTGQQTLLVIVENNEVIGCGTVQFINYPNERVAFITSCGGKAIVCPEVFDQIEVWMRSMGATKIQAWAKDLQARLYRQAVKFTVPCNIVEKLL